jgi:hypothetical protein
MRYLIPPALMLILALPAAAEGTETRLTDAQAEALAKEALAATDAKTQAGLLKRLKAHHFKSSQAKERELLLFAQGTLEDRLGEDDHAAATFRKLEQTWPRSAYLPDAQSVLAAVAVDHKRYKEAESRLHKALAADIPAETARRCQELLLWCLAEEGKAGDGIELIKALKPLGTANPTEKGLVGMLEAYCAARDRAGAQGAVNDYHQIYPKGPRGLRVDLGWAKLLGLLGEGQNAAQAFQKLILAGPQSPEADEARLALATLLTDGKLSAKEAEAFPSAKTLLGELHTGSTKEGPARQALLVRLRIALKEHHWQELIDGTEQYRGLRPSEAELAQVTGLRAEALRAWSQDLLDKHQLAPLLPYLDGDAVAALTPELRLGLARRMSQTGLPEAARALVNAVPLAERGALRAAALEGTTAYLNPQGTLGLLATSKGESAHDSLLRAQASLTLHDWPAARVALAKARPGSERIQALLALLTRPAEAGDKPSTRLKEVEAWLGRSPEKPGDREPLLILAADLRARTGDWRGALARYPAAPQAGNRGWVALMRATCLNHLGQKAPAKAVLQEASADPSYLRERKALGQQLGM